MNLENTHLRATERISKVSPHISHAKREFAPRVRHAAVLRNAKHTLFRDASRVPNVSLQFFRRNRNGHFLATMLPKSAFTETVPVTTYDAESTAKLCSIANSRDNRYVLAVVRHSDRHFREEFPFTVHFYGQIPRLTGGSTSSESRFIMAIVEKRAPLCYPN